MKQLEEKTVIRLNSKSMETLKNALIILDDMLDDLIELSSNEDLDLLKDECGDALMAFHDFLDAYARYTKESE